MKPAEATASAAGAAGQHRQTAERRMARIARAAPRPPARRRHRESGRSGLSVADRRRRQSDPASVKNGNGGLRLDAIRRRWTPADSDKAARAEIKRRLAESKQGDPTSRKYLSEPPLRISRRRRHRAAERFGEDEYKKERRLKKEAAQGSKERRLVRLAALAKTAAFRTALPSQSASRFSRAAPEKILQQLGRFSSAMPG